MNNAFILRLDKEIVYIRLVDNNLYYIEDSTGIYKMNGKIKDYVDYLLNKGWELQN